MGQLAKRSVPFLIFAAVAAGLVTGAYAVLAHFFQDRQSALSSPRVSENAPIQRRDSRGAATAPGAKAVKRPNEIPGQTATDAGQAAIQRQLKTLEEINAINEMNRRLMEQQRRMQNQR